MTEDMFAQKGWICPKCGRVLAPLTMYCLWCCSDMKESITATGTSIIGKDELQINADQHIQHVESVGNNDEIIVRSNLEPFRVDEPQKERSNHE